MFEDLGYFKEYYVNKKFIGIVICNKDRDVFGYSGSIVENLKDKIICTNGRIIKQGTQVMTYLYPLCGKKIK
jgi:hypothetical protein